MSHGHLAESVESSSPVRRKMLDVAQSVIEVQGGLSVSLDSVSLDMVARAADVPRSSAYRVWSSKELFQLDLMCDLAGPSWQGTAAFDEETIRVARTIVAEHLGMLATAEGRWSLMREAVRQAAHQNFVAVTTSTQWRTYVTLTATVMSLRSDVDRGRVTAALQEAEQTFIRRMANFYEDMAIVLGFRMRPGRGNYEVLAAAGAAVVEGLALRQLLAPDTVDSRIELENGSFDSEWTLPAFGFLSILEHFVEPDPDYDPSRALSQYLAQLAARESAT